MGQLVLSGRESYSPGCRAGFGLFLFGFFLSCVTLQWAVYFSELKMNGGGGSVNVLFFPSLFWLEYPLRKLLTT